MATTKKATLQSLTHEMRAQIKPSYLMSEVYSKLKTYDPNKKGIIETLYDWKFIAKTFPNKTKWDKFLNMPMSIDNKLRLATKLSNISSIHYGEDGIDRLEIAHNYNREYHFMHNEPDNWDGELFIEDFDIKNDVDVAVLWILNNCGVTFYWDDGSWEMLEQEYDENPHEDYEFDIHLFNKYNNIAAEWKHKFATYKKGITPIIKHLQKKSLSDVDRLWYSLILYMETLPAIYEFQTPEEGNLWLTNKYKIIPKNTQYQEQMKPFRNEWGYCSGFTYYMNICDSAIYHDTLQYYADAPHDVYDLVFNKNYWFHNYSPQPYYANKIKSFVSFEPRYNSLLQCTRQTSLHGTIESVQRKILRFYNLIKGRNKELAAKNRN